MKQPIYEWDGVKGIARCVIWDQDGNEHEGTAYCHEDDFDMMSKLTGFEIARARAELSAYKAFRYKVKTELGALKQLYYSMKHSSNFNPKSYENLMLQRQIKLKEEDLETVKNIITGERIKLKIYITEKDSLYKQIRTLKAKKAKGEENKAE